MDDKTFEVSVKGVVFSGKKVLFLNEANGTWDLPGGRMRHGENFGQALVRECQEEIGVKCRVLDKTPVYAWVARDKNGSWRVMLCFRIVLEHLNFRLSDECVRYDYFDKDAIDTINCVPQIRPLKDFLD